MAQHHVQLKINNEGLVTSVENLNQNEIYETCVLCGKLTDVLINTHIDYRYGYVEGSGQACRNCYNKTYNVQNDYVKTIMKNRTTLITISAEDILNTPNDFDLGAKVRSIYWSQNNQNTSNINYDYLDGTDDLNCNMKTNI